MRNSNKLLHYLRSNWWLWAGLGIFLSLSIGYFIFQLPWIQALPGISQALFIAIVFLILLMLYLVIKRMLELYEQREQLRYQLIESNAKISRTQKRLEAIFQLGKKYVEANDESEIIEFVLQLAVNLNDAQGASFVPLDEHGQPLTIYKHGEMPASVIDPWLEYLATPAIREQCRSCDNHEHLTKTCPLLAGPMNEEVSVYCLPMRRGEKEFGVMNIFLPNSVPLDEEQQAFLGALIDESALAIESNRLRLKELNAIRQMQMIRQRNEFSIVVNGLLDSVRQTHDADFVILNFVSQDPSAKNIKTVRGVIPPQSQSISDALMQGVVESGKPVLVGDVTGEPESKPGVRSILCVPLTNSEQKVLGVLLIGTNRSKSFAQRQMVVLQTLASQIVYATQNIGFIAEIEFQAMIEERKRLAREIHDGLAQTLGLLKLQAAQMKNYISRNDWEKARTTLDQYYGTLSEAYSDVRQSIDGLRTNLNDEGIDSWLEQIIAGFNENSDIPITLNKADISVRVAPEIIAQLMRILQEGLSNVRKHSGASELRVDYFIQGDDLYLEIQDNGIGFNPEDVSEPSRHGLRGMRERADLIGADFQIISRPEKGTVIRVRIPNCKSRSEEKL